MFELFSVVVFSVYPLAAIQHYKDRVAAGGICYGPDPGLFYHDAGIAYRRLRAHRLCPAFCDQPAHPQGHGGIQLPRTFTKGYGMGALHGVCFCAHPPTPYLPGAAGMA